MVLWRFRSGSRGSSGEVGRRRVVLACGFALTRRVIFRGSAKITRVWFCPDPGPLLGGKWRRVVLACDFGVWKNFNRNPLKSQT